MFFPNNQNRRQRNGSGANNRLKAMIAAVVVMVSVVFTSQAMAATASDIIGSWGYADTTWGVAMTFLADGNYIAARDVGGVGGMIRGTYSWDAGTETWSLSNLTSSPLSINGNLLGSGDGIVHSLPRVRDIADSIVGSWYGYNLGEAGGMGVFTFMSNGFFVMANDGDRALDPSGQPGMERGRYTWDSTTGAFFVTVLADTNGQWGLSHGWDYNILVNGNTLTLTGSDYDYPNGGSSITLARVAPVPLPAALWLFAPGLVGLVAVRKRSKK